MTQQEAIRSFLLATRKRKGEAFYEDGLWTAIGADGHVWIFGESEGWVRWTEDDDEHVVAVRRGSVSQ